MALDFISCFLSSKTLQNKTNLGNTGHLRAVLVFCPEIVGKFDRGIHARSLAENSRPTLKSEMMTLKGRNGV